VPTRLQQILQLTSISVANERYLKYFVEIILKLKFLIYRTYSDRYNIIGDQTVSGYLSTLLTCFYKYPIPSSHLGIYKFTCFQIRLELRPINSIVFKVMIISYNDCYLTFELIHS
jgi:hypothetical protein